jgi:peptidoglycan hydrolase-like protein with peptidoglycan-binding domain
MTRGNASAWRAVVAVVGLSALLFSGTPVRAQDAAQGIFQAAVALYRDAEARPDDTRLDDYRSVRRLLDLIVTSHPGSDLAVQILLQQNIEGLDVAALDRALSEAPDAAAIVPEAQNDPATAAGVQPGPAIVDPFAAAAPLPGVDPVSQPLAEPVPAARSETEIVRDMQTELNRLGCNAGGADGVAGPRTRAAFRMFLRNTGSPTGEDTLATEAALAEVRAVSDRVCSLRWVSRTAPERLSGSWGYRADCQMVFRRVRITGTLDMRYQGDGQFTGTARNSLGERGSAAARVSGNAVSTLLSFPTARVQGNFVTSTSSMSMSGRDSNGCDVVAWKS